MFSLASNPQKKKMCPIPRTPWKSELKSNDMRCLAEEIAGQQNTREIAMHVSTSCHVGMGVHQSNRGRSLGQKPLPCHLLASEFTEELQCSQTLQARGSRHGLSGFLRLPGLMKGNRSNIFKRSLTIILERSFTC